MNRISAVAFNTFREAVRDHVLYNLIFFALLLVGAALLFGQISIGIQRIVLVNLGLTAISVFGVVIAIFIGIGLVSKEMEKKTLYTILSRPVRRWEFIVGKFGGLAWTLVVNTLAWPSVSSPRCSCWPAISSAPTAGWWWPSTSSSWNSWW